jgi:hypothetical protein
LDVVAGETTILFIAWELGIEDHALSPNIHNKSGDLA